MPLPTDVNSLNLSGKYILDTSLSDLSDIHKSMVLLGLSGPQITEAIREGVTTIEINSHKDANGVEHFDLRQVYSDGRVGVDGKRTCDWKDEKCDDPLVGPIIVKTRRAAINQLSDELLPEWKTNEDALNNGVIEGLFSSDTEKSGRTWTCHSVMGIRDTKSGRRLTFTTRVSGPKEAEVCSATYYLDYAGPL